ncbi:MAG: glycoside hydrolase family 95 protein [Dysgonamonadaceae bacterium]|jgi:alpha-L-fucosidase 2|nr:glycoside hydrolase family 95 protein [Dysgonamonadaceae bacterium]
MYKHFYFSLIATVLCFLGNFEASGQNLPELQLHYNTPASKWESEALPLGNGFTGAMVFGGVVTDVIQINNHSLWSGGTGKNSAYNGGHSQTAEQNRQSLQNIRNALQEKMTAFSNSMSAYIDDEGNVVAENYPDENDMLKKDIKSLMGDKTDFGSYQSLGNINIDCISKNKSYDYTNYSRILDIDNALITVAYTMEGVNYKREYFISNPDNVLAIRLTADKPGMISRNIWLTTPQTAATVSAENDVVTLTGQPADHGANGLKFAQQLKVIPAGGTLRVSENKIVVENANEIIILSSTATNYTQCQDDSFNYFSGTDPLSAVQETLNRAAQKTFEQLLSSHKNDYHSLYNRMTLSFAGAANSNGKTVNELLSGYKNGTNMSAENLYIELLYYQFGRYLLISSSRKNGLPANLQGIWADGLKPPWNADYHTNINLQMNYWLAEQTNLADCHLPVIEYVKSLVPRGRITAGHYYCKSNGDPVRGWVIHHENNVWGNTAPGVWYAGFYFPAAAGWMCQDIWEYYQFNHDKNLLEEYYPILLDAALFWVDNLWRDTRDGTLVANPSYSPEHGPYSLGASCDQAIITELFDFVLKAAQVLNKNSSELDEIKTAKTKLAKPQIGLGGQFMEWKDELKMDISGDNAHRHVNHLFWLHPGSQIIAGRSAQDNLYVEAMKNTLNTRGDGGTGWSKAWKINFWARLRDGNHSHKLLEELLKESTLSNLFDTHPPFQIDGNFGATAGMTEMLIQSQSEFIEILPALPNKWATGSFRGIKARGAFELSAEWTNCMLNRMEIISLSGSKCKLKYPGIMKYNIVKSNGENVLFDIIDDNTVSFETKKGEKYRLYIESKRVDE